MKLSDGDGQQLLELANGRNLRIGAHAVVGTGAIVIQNVAPGQTVLGKPARALRLELRGGPERRRSPPSAVAPSHV